MRRVLAGFLLLLAFAWVPSAAAHLGPTTVSDLAQGSSVPQTVTIDFLVHANSGFVIIVSTEPAREAGVNLTHAGATFNVTRGPDAELDRTRSRITNQTTSDIKLELADRDGLEDNLTIRIDLVGVDTTRVPSNDGDEITATYTFTAVAHRNSQTEEQQGSTGVFFKIRTNPNYETSKSPGVEVGLALVALILLTWWRRRAT